MFRFRNALLKLPPWLLSALTILLILWLTLMPDPLGDNSPRLFPGADKMVHAIMFGFLTVMILLDRQRRERWRPQPVRVVLAAMAGSSSLGILIEVLQRAMAMGRGFEVADMIADIAGAVICGWCWLKFQKIWSGRSS